MKEGKPYINFVIVPRDVFKEVCLTEQKITKSVYG
jgi:hypothetical protein